MTTNPSSVFLTLHGVPTSQPPEQGCEVFCSDPLGGWRLYHGDHLYEIEAKCLELHDAFAAAIFGNIEIYYEILPVAPSFLAESGLNAESPLSRDEFQKALIASREMPLLHNLLYLYDCRKLVSGIQECSKEVCILMGEFYRKLNLDDLFPPSFLEPDGLRWVSSPAATALIAIMNVIYIRLFSLFDYITKLAYEVDNIRSDFTQYPKLASSNIQFGDRRRLKWSRPDNTLFESSDVTDEVELFRNFIIHDGLLDDMPKVYKLICGGNVMEKFILMPDRTGARLDRFNNRTLFFSKDDKINMRLPSLVKDVQKRQVVTLAISLERLKKGMKT